MRFTGNAVALLLTVAMLGGFTSSVNASEIRLTSASGDSWHSSLDVDGSGNIHIVWQDTRDGNDEIYYTKLDNTGTTLIDDTRLTSDVAVSEWPQLDLDGQGNVHIIWRDYRDGAPEVYYTKLDNLGNVVVDDTRQTVGSNNIWGMDLRSNSSGHVNVVWVDYRHGDPEIYYAKLDNDGAKLVNDTRLTAANGECRWPHIVVDSADNTHVVWYDARSGNAELYYEKLNADGSTIVDDTRLTFSGSVDGSPHLRVDPSNNVHVVWADTRDVDNKLYYTKLDSIGGTLLDDVAVTDISCCGYWLDLDDYDLYITWNDDRHGNTEVYFGKLNDNGSPLIPDTRITNDPSSSLWPRICVDGNSNYHIVWDEDRDGNRELYYINSYIITDVHELDGVRPMTFELSQNYPNPFNPSTVIQFDLPRRSHVSIAIFNLLSQKVIDLANEEYPAGSHQITWDGVSSSGQRVSTGIYFFRLVAEDFINTKKMILLK